MEKDDNKVLYIRTDFKGGKYVSSMVGGFNAYCFIGTIEEYNKACEPFYKDEGTYGKITGYHPFKSLEEYNEYFGIDKIPEKKEMSAEDLEFCAKWESIWDAELERKLKKQKFIENI